METLNKRQMSSLMSAGLLTRGLKHMIYVDDKGAKIDFSKSSFDFTDAEGRRYYDNDAKVYKTAEATFTAEISEDSFPVLTTDEAINMLPTSINYNGKTYILDIKSNQSDSQISYVCDGQQCSYFDGKDAIFEMLLWVFETGLSNQKVEVANVDLASTDKSALKIVNTIGLYITTNFKSYNDACTYASAVGGKVGAAYHHVDGHVSAKPISEPLTVNPGYFEGEIVAFDPEREFVELKSYIAHCSTIDDVNELLHNYNATLMEYENSHDDEFISFDRAAKFKYLGVHKIHPTSYTDERGCLTEVCVIENQNI